MQRSSVFTFFLVLPNLCFLAACDKHDAPAPLPPPTVTVSKPIEKPVTDYADFTGRTDAVFSTDIRPRVTGYLVAMPFREGAHVRKDEVLFEIDDRPYKAALDSAQATEAGAKAALVKSQAEYDMDLRVKKENAGAVSDEDIIKKLGNRDMAKAEVDRDAAAVVTAQLNYDWCKVRSPIDGEVGRYLFTIGNLVNADASLLTTVVSAEPMYVYFDVDENTMLNVLRTIVLPSSSDPMAKPGAVPVLMGLSDEQGFPHQGYINFGNNVVSASTGTVTIRGVFDNPANSIGKRLLRPGMFVRVRVPLGKPHSALLVSEKALGSDQGQKYLLLVEGKGSDKEVVKYRPVKTGPLQDDGLRVISEGLTASDLVIVDGLQAVRPEMTVKVEEVAMQASPLEAAPEQPKQGSK